MPEYRRFVAYFYEYINGKKQKSAGFAKVELRNGMWRILFRLTLTTFPEPPVQVYGFARERGYLLGFPLGIIRPATEISEEWAYRADVPVGMNKYRFADLSGIWIQSGDGRCCITVWDDEGIDTGKFVLELPEISAGDSEKKTEAEEKVPPKQEGEENQEKDQAEGWQEETEPEQENEEEEKPDQTEEIESEQDQEPAVVKGVYQDQEPAAVKGVYQEQKIQGSEIPVGEKDQEEDQEEDRECRNAVEKLFRKRLPFQPFEDREIENCVQIMPCDVLRLQQENWQVGRSSFLQHGFYQYRHLLLGRMADGSYVLGVPGIRNPQEKYMAQMFGFGRFKVSQIYHCGMAFGYWCRILKNCYETAKNKTDKEKD